MEEFLVYSLMALFVLWLLYKFCYKSFIKGINPENANLSREEIRAKQETLSKERRKKIITVICPNITKKLTSDGFSSLNSVEKEILFQLSDQVATNAHNLHENEIKALEVACSNQATYNLLEMRSNQLSRMNQSAVLANLKGVKAASMVSGIHAAREIGESFSED
jgi:hypothetical protein